MCHNFWVLGLESHSYWAQAPTACALQQEKALKETCESEVKLLNHVQLFATPWTVARQASLSMGFSRQEYWSGLLFPSPGGSSQPRDRTRVSCIAGRRFILWATREAWKKPVLCNKEYLLLLETRGSPPTAMKTQRKDNRNDPWKSCLPSLSWGPPAWASKMQTQIQISTFPFYSCRTLGNYSSLWLSLSSWVK